MTPNLRIVAVAVSCGCVLTSAGTAYGLEFDPLAAKLAKEIEAGWSVVGPNATIPNEMAEKLIALGDDRGLDRSMDVVLIAVYGLAFAVDESSEKFLSGIAARNAGGKVLPGMAKAALAWRAARAKPLGTRWRELAARARATENVCERRFLVAFLGRFFLQESKGELLGIMEEEADENSAYFIAVMVGNGAGDRETLGRIHRGWQKRKYTEIDLGVAQFLATISGNGKIVKGLSRPSFIYMREIEEKVKSMK